YKTPSSAPTVSKVEPAKGSIFGGTDITITGTDFRAGARVIIGGAEAAGVEVVSPIRIKAVTPARPQGKAPVTVMNPDAGSATLKDGFEYVAPATLPEITGVNPGRGSTKGGTVVTITGREFADGAEVYIGGERCPSVELVSASELIIITPPGTPGVKDVVVVNPDTGLARLDDAFEYVVPNSTPVIKSIGPVKGSVLGGTRVSIQGSDFRAGARITFGGRDAGVVSIRDEQGREVDGIVAVSGVSIVVTTPPNTPGKKDVVVENPDAGVATLAEGFEYVDVSGTGMQIDGIWPEKGRVEGGTPVTITGSGFAEGAAVYIGGAPATNVHVVDEKTVKARTPANTAGKKDVTVQNPDGSACTLTDGFEYMVPGTQPDIISVEPNAGSTAGGTRIEIKGRNFDNPIVFIGETRAEPVSLGPTLIVVITPPGAPGPADVIVVNEDTGLDILEEGFTYKVYPTITSVTPNSGPTAGGTRITIFGTAFAQGAAVFIGDKAATDVNFVSETTLTALTPAHDPGAKPV
ncbi:MAG: IPT/TIG domain-containing protein, partial [Moorella sp. (in: Bacteria)]|nr:IPT/TIG domain-containing protein [Moorella sp. (in: firmicutes)]